jgi:hypothetical protein
LIAVFLLFYGRHHFMRRIDMGQVLNYKISYDARLKEVTLLLARTLFRPKIS